MLGGYVGLSVVRRTGSFVAALACGALIGVGMSRGQIRAHWDTGRTGRRRRGQSP